MYTHVRRHVRKHKVKIFAAFGMILIGASVAALLNWHISQAQTTGPKFLQVADIDSVNGMQTSNPLANYPAGNSAYPGQEIQYDNEGISIFIMNSSYALNTIKTDASNANECGHLGIQSWQGANYAYKLTDGNTWQKRVATCNGIVVIGASGQIRAQTLTIKGTSVTGKPFTLNVNVPDYAVWDDEVGGGSRRLYVDDTGATYGCYTKGGGFSRIWPNECQYSPTEALTKPAVGSGFGTIAGNGLCQSGETYATTPQDCPAPPTCTLTPTKTSYTKPEYVNYTYTCSAPTSVAVQVVKPDGIATTYNTATNITTSTMGFDTSNLDAGNYTLRICVNDTTCSPSSLVSVPFTLVAPEPVCTLTLAKTSYTTTETVNYTYRCTRAAKVDVKVVKPDGVITLINSANAPASVDALGGFPASKGAVGSNTLRICIDDTLAGTCASSVSLPLTISSGTGASPALLGYWKFDGNGNNEVAGSPAATIVGGSSFKTTGGKNGGYGYIPTGSDSFKIPYDARFDLPDSFTIQFWFRQRANQSFNQNLVYKGSAPNNYNFNISRWLWNEYNKGPVIAGHTAANTGYWTQPSNPNELAHNEWHNVVFTKSPNYHAYYLDGVLIGSKEITATSNSEYGGPAKTPANDIIIGDTAVDTDIDDLKIYNYVLTAGDVSAIGGFPISTMPCTGMNLSTNKTSYALGESITFNYSCASPANGYLNSLTIQVIPPNGASNNAVNVATINPVSGATNISSSGTQTISSSYFTSTGSYTIRTCMNSNCTTSGLNSIFANYTSSGTTNGTTTTTTPGASAPEPMNDEAAVWAQVDVATGQILTTAICKKSVCGINGEYHGYVPPATWATGSVWWPTSKRYIWQKAGDSGYSPGTFNFSTYVFTVQGGTIYNGVFTPTTTTTDTTTTATTTTTTTVSIAKACGNGEKCPSGSWCTNGSMCYYPDKQIRCEAWPASSTTGIAASIAPIMNMPSCTDGTSPCSPDDNNCVAPGQTVAYSSGSSKWCAQSQQYYSTDGKNMKCVKMNDPAPAGYSTCRPDDTNCIPSGSYGKSDGWCSMGMTCYQKTTDSDPKNDKYCAQMNYNSTPPADVACPSNYSYCSPTDTYCKQKGETWTDSNSSNWCSNSQKCNLASGGGSCVSWNEGCPAGTKYCSANDTYCVEPGEYKNISSIAGSMSSYWCGGGGGMTFYSTTKAYCEPKKAGSTMTMWSAADIKAILTKLGAGWGLCSPGNTNCIEPGKTGPSSGWCAWTTPGMWSSMSPSSDPNAKRTCPSLDDTVTPPLPPEPPVCLQVITKALNSSTGECKVFSDSCLPAGWVKNTDCKPGEIVPPEKLPPPEGPRECGPNETPGMGVGGPITWAAGTVESFYAQTCVMPMYRWNIDKKEFEKCDRKKTPPYINVMGNLKATHTNCESFNFEIEREWRAERFAAHDPRVDGEWYMPPWDASTEMQQYNPRSDQFEACNMKRIAVMSPLPNEYFAPCTPVPEKDRAWMLKKFRAENKMFQLWQRTTPVPPGQPTPTPVPMPQPVPMPLYPGNLTPAQCKTYLKGIRQSVSGDKMFLKQINTQLAQVPDEYADKATVQQLYKDAVAIVVDADKYLKIGKCHPSSMSALQEELNTLRTDIFSDISSYLPDVQNFIDAGHCKVGLTDKVKQLQGLLKNGLDDETKAEIEDLIISIEDKMKELSERSGDFDYDAGFECRQFSGKVESQVAPLLRSGDKELNRIIEDVVSQKLEPVIEKLSAELGERGKKIDELLVKVAELHKAVESISKSATQISENIAVSYTALSRIEDKFAEQKAQIQETKDRLISLIEKATALMKNVSCVRGADREKMVQEFGSIATVNWFGERADALEKRLNLFIASCNAREVNPAYVTAFMTSIDDAERQNMEASYAAGLTRFPDVPTHEWYYGAMMTAGENGFMTQGRPGENVLKQDALLMILRASGAPESEITGNCTLRAAGVSSVSPYAVCAANYAYGKGLVLSGSLTIPISRVEMVAWLVKLAEVPAADLSVLEKYTDLAGLSDSEKTAIAAVVAREIMVGNVSGDSAKFDVRSPITRASLAVILEKMTMQNPLKVLPPPLEPQ